MMQWMRAILVCGTITALVSCSNDDNVVESEPQEYTGVPLIILDTDIGSSTGPTRIPSSRSI